MTTTMFVHLSPPSTNGPLTACPNFAGCDFLTGWTGGRRDGRVEWDEQVVG